MFWVSAKICRNFTTLWAVIAQSVLPLAAGWTVRESNPGGARFSAPVQTGHVPHPASCTIGYRVSFLGVKRPGRAVNHPPPSSTEVKERVELYLCSPSGLHGLFQGELYLTIYMTSTDFYANSAQSLIIVIKVRVKDEENVDDLNVTTDHDKNLAACETSLLFTVNLLFVCCFRLFSFLRPSSFLHIISDYPNTTTIHCCLQIQNSCVLFCFSYVYKAKYNHFHKISVFRIGSTLNTVFSSVAPCTTVQFSLARSHTAAPEASQCCFSLFAYRLQQYRKLT